MATISIAENDARIQYTQAVTANVTPLTIDFPFFELDDNTIIFGIFFFKACDIVLLFPITTLIVIF